MSVRIWRLGALACLLMVGVSACDALNSIGPEICRRPIDDEPILYCGGDVEGGIYMSSSWGVEPDTDEAPLLYFPGGEYYRINHRLGVEPRMVQLYLSFSPYGIADSPVAPSAGNQATIRDVTPDYIEILNESCVDYYLLVVATAGDEGEGGGDGAGVVSQECEDAALDEGG